MTDPFLAEIRIFAGNYAPNGWALCNGQLMSIQQNTALFSLLGVTYGGNGSTNFALPNLQGSAPMQQGQGPSLSPRDLGEVGGEPSVLLQPTEMPMHTHTPQGLAGSGSTGSPTNAVWAEAMLGRQSTNLYSTAAPNVNMNPQTTQINGGGQAHNNMPPYLTVSFIIALQGIFPQRP
ncbi:MAG: Tail Collar domain protein [Frankiales bacterium]|nr:Tail Collar domain protein [Frankiales bacterium]